MITDAHGLKLNGSVLSCAQHFNLEFQYNQPTQNKKITLQHDVHATKVIAPALVAQATYVHAMSVGSAFLQLLFVMQESCGKIGTYYFLLNSGSRGVTVYPLSIKSISLALKKK